MAIAFIEENHKYVSINEENINWVSATSFIGKFKQPFNADEVAEKVTKSKKSKWYGMTKQEILDAWKAEADRAIELGNWYHNQRESDLLEFDKIERHGKEVPIIRPIIENNMKLAPNQKIEDGVYPEHFVYLKSHGICGQSDLVEVVDGYVHITDYKTNKEIKTKSFTNWEGISQRMLDPVAHLDDCNLNHYNLQLSLYMYIILKHNRRLKPGKLVIQHVKFKKLGETASGYPITEYVNGEPVIDDIDYYELPYLRDEVIQLLHYLNENREKFVK